ncbi:MAG: oligoendopeptidase F [Clostridia bacterium]|nr:oligoendopeptidase F [Clostridia bacterium]
MKRSEIELKYKWNTDEILTGKQEFIAKLDEIKKVLSFSDFKGRLNNVKTIKECFEKVYYILGQLEVLSVYAMMKKDEDGTNPLGNELSCMVEEVYVKFSSEVSFIDPELSRLGKEKLTEIANNPEMSLYDLDIKKVIEMLPHLLSEETEMVLSLGGKVYGGYDDAFSMLDNVDLDFPSIKVDNEKVKVTHATYSLLLQNPNQNVRKSAFKSYYKAYAKVLNTITALYKGNVDKDVFLARVRKFPSSLAKALFAEEVDVKVYKNLISSVHKALPTLHRYIADRKTILGQTIHMYDLYVPITENADLKLDYEEAFDLVLEGLKPLGEDYLNLLRRAKNERWIDVYENDGKRSGAYSVSVYNTPHPYVLLNHNKTTHSVFTIAHELGHSIHSYFSNKTQPETKADYKIFVAEVASTVNEILLIKYLIANAKDDKTKKYFLSYYLDTIRTTLFRQTMFSEFEEKAHAIAEKGEPFTKEVLNSIYLKLNKKYYGKSVVSDKEISFEWARIPHFYRAFYVYKYATGIISAIAIAERILSGGEKEVKEYFDFLSSGCSNIPTELLKLTGVDLLGGDAMDLAFKSFEDALTEFEKFM